ncbi:MAG: hypothetical protein L0K86_00365 [Actinomycetia bacterium]|nr:hypothetical protein [Actinomycetes bacterium]
MRDTVIYGVGSEAGGDTVPDVLVVVVPGIGGSVLADPRDESAAVWGARPGDVVDLVRHPDRLGLDRRLEPVGLIRSTSLLGFTIVPGYEDLMRGLNSLGVTDERGDPCRPVPNATVVAAPYDFRRSIADAARRLDAVVGAHLGDATEAERAGRVVVVGHSLGGLVARYWMGVMQRWPWCRSLVTIATPHRGAPKALGWWVNGPRVLGRTLKGPLRLVREWPSVAELLPRYEAVHDATTGTWCYPHDLPLPALTGSARDAYALHEQIEQSWGDMPRRGPEMLTWLGWSHPTAESAVWDGSGLEVAKVRPGWLAGSGWDRDLGDGTVPAISAVPIESSHHAGTITRLRARHVPMVNTPSVVALLRGYLARASIDWVRGDEDADHPPALGLDLDELYAAGEPIPVAVAGREIDPALGGRPVWAALRPSGDEQAEPAEVRLARDDATGAFVGAFPGQSPGMYEVSVSVREVPGAGDLDVADTIAVLGDE